MRKLYTLLPPKAKHTHYWHCRIYLGGGRRVQRSTHVTTHGAAREFVALYLRHHHPQLHRELVTGGAMRCEPRLREKPAPPKTSRCVTD